MEAESVAQWVVFNSCYLDLTAAALTEEAWIIICSAFTVDPPDTRPFTPPLAFPDAALPTPPPAALPDALPLPAVLLLPDFLLLLPAPPPLLFLLK